MSFRRPYRSPLPQDPTRCPICGRRSKWRRLAQIYCCTRCRQLAWVREKRQRQAAITGKIQNSW
jgi:endogenous inhibitor of DNA gyrase (YacG/DUF329 family)